MYQRHHLHRNVNRLIDTKEMNRISGKPLKTRDSGTLGVAGIPCLFSGVGEDRAGAENANGHSGHSSDPSVAVLTPAAENVTTVVTVLTPPPCPI